MYTLISVTVYFGSDTSIYYVEQVLFTEFLRSTMIVVLVKQGRLYVSKEKQPRGKIELWYSWIKRTDFKVLLKKPLSRKTASSFG